MFTPLLKSERFVNEYTMFSEGIEKITDKPLKAKLTQDLVALKTTVQAVDEQHERLMFGGKNDLEVTDLRDKIKLLRQTIDTQLRAWQSNH